MKLTDLVNLPELPDVLDADTFAAAAELYKEFRRAKRPGSEEGKKLSPAEKARLKLKIQLFLGSLYE